ncbi:DNA polymerase III subunit psi [Candidatus Mikella endobia]
MKTRSYWLLQHMVIMQWTLRCPKVIKKK